MLDDVSENSEFQSFRVLKGDTSPEERNQLFGHLAQLFSLVSEKCDDEQVAQYDQVLCQLAELVEVEARSQVSQVLAGLSRAPGRVVVRLAGDEIEVARPLLEFSKVLSDDDLIDIAAGLTEAHRVSIANRKDVGARVGDAIVEHGEQPSMARLVGNDTATLSTYALEKIVATAANDSAIAADLRSRTDVDWANLESQISEAGARVMSNLSLSARPVVSDDIEKANALVYARMRNRAGFSAEGWKLAWNQVKAMNDRRQLDKLALARFARFGYGHHLACGLTVMLNVPSEVFVKWLSAQDYVAFTVALRALGIESKLFSELFIKLPWRDTPSRVDVIQVAQRFETLGFEEARDIFRLWRAHTFRRKANVPSRQAAVA